MFMEDLIGFANEAYELQVYNFPQFEKAFMDAAKRICERI